MLKIKWLLIIMMVFSYSVAEGYSPWSDQVQNDTTNFDSNLSSADDTVQKALDTLDDTAGGGGAPTNATYITQTASAGLSNEQAISSLSDGLLKHASGVFAQAVADTDYDSSTTNEFNTIQGDDNVATSGLAISIDGSGIATTDVVGDVLTITATEVDGSTTNEINTIQGDDNTPTSGLVISIDGGEGLDTAVIGDVLTVSGEDATDTNKGIAKFNANDFLVSSGDVTVKADGIDDLQIEFGTGTNQVSLDDIPEGITAYYTYNTYNGTFKETFDADVTSNGTVVTMSIEQTGGGSLTTQFSSGVLAYDTSTPDTIALTAGSDVSPQANWIYILQSAPTTLVKSTSAWPDAEHIKVGFFFVQSAASVQTDNGIFINQNWNDHLIGTDKQGHITHMAQKIRNLGSTYFSGIDGNGATASYFTLGVGNSEFIATSGIVYQMHKQTFPVVNTSTGSIVHVFNSSVSAYRRITDLFSITTDNTGATISNNKYFNLVFWGVINKTGERQLLMVNTPGGFYNTQTSAINDVSGFDVFSIPREFGIDSSNGFLIARTTFKMGTTWTHVSTVDLRGINPQTASGGIGGVATDFADNAFTIFDNADNTKILTFDVGTNVTTGTTRTLQSPDASGIMALTSQSDGTIDHGADISGLGDNDHTQYELNLVNSTGLAAAIDDETGTGLVVFNADPTITGNIRSENKHFGFTIFDPLGVQTDDTQVCIRPATDAALTITKITVTLDAAGNEILGDLKYADTFIGLANPVVINDFDTTSGVRADSTITSATVASGKAIYIQFDSAPNTAITQACFDIEYDYDI